MSKIKTNSPTHLSLSVFTEFRASHSLQGFETPHFHLWKIAAQFQKELPLESDRLIDLAFLQETLDKLLTPLAGSFLNESLGEIPTSENLALWIWGRLIEKLPTAPLSAVEVTLCSLDGVASGTARIWK